MSLNRIHEVVHTKIHICLAVLLKHDARMRICGVLYGMVLDIPSVRPGEEVRRSVASVLPVLWYYVLGPYGVVDIAIAVCEHVVSCQL